MYTMGNEMLTFLGLLGLPVTMVVLLQGQNLGGFELFTAQLLKLENAIPGKQ